MQVFQYMKKEVVTCTGNDTVAQAAKTMAEHNIGAIIVVEDRKPIGIFTERDLLKRVVVPGKNASDVLIKDVMTPDPIAARGKDSLGRTHLLLIQKKVRHLPVTQEGRLVGIISERDVSKILSEQFYQTYFDMETPGDFSGDY